MEVNNMDETTSEAPKQSNSMMMVVGIIVVLLVVGVGIFMMRNKSQTSQTDESVTDMNEGEAMNDDQSTNAAPSAAMTETSTATESSMAMEDSTVKTFNIEAGSFYYKPNVINVKKGDKVKIVMNSVDMMHDFNIDELNVKLPITKSGETNTVEFTADTAGTFEFYCSVGQHRAQGQIGTITVTE
jgi:nitrosocyanin